MVMVMIFPEMWPARVFLLLFTLCLYVYRINCTCDPEVVDKIKGLGFNPSTVLENLKGEYVMYHFASGDMDEAMKKECCKLKFYKNGRTHILEYERLIDGAYALELRDGAFVHRRTVHDDDEPEMTYYTFINDLDLFGVYVCNKQEEEVSTDLTYLAVPVRRPTVDLEKTMLEAKKLIAKLGLPAGVDSDGCFKGENDKPGECKMEKRPFYVVECPPSVTPPSGVPTGR